MAQVAIPVVLLNEQEHCFHGGQELGRQAAMDSTIASPRKLTSEIRGHKHDQGKTKVQFLARKGGIDADEEVRCWDCSVVYLIQKAEQTTG